MMPRSLAMLLLALFTSSLLAAYPPLIPLDRPPPAHPPLVPVGMVRVDVTPITPIRMSGFGNRATESEGVAQKLYARAIAIGDGKDASVLVAVDCLGIPGSITDEVADKASV